MIEADRDKLVRELQELDGLKPSSLKAAVAERDYQCHGCRTKIAQGSEVLWIRFRDDEVESAAGRASTWRHKPYHRRCYDEVEHDTDVRRQQIERELGIE